MANSILKKHQLDITVGVELNDAQRKATSAQIKNMASQWQDMFDDAIKKGIEDGARSASLKDVLTQLNAQLKAFKLEPLTITVDELQIMDKPIEHAAKLVIQKLGDSFKGGGLGNIISEEITDSLDMLGGTVDKIYQKMEQGAKKSASNMEQYMLKVQKAASKISKDQMKNASSAMKSTKLISIPKEQANAQSKFQEMYTTSKNQTNKTSIDAQIADVAFVRSYEQLAKKNKLSEVFGDQLSEVTEYYTKLEKIHQNKMNYLNDILVQNEYVGGTKAKPIQYNQFKGGEPWAREKTLQEVKNILSGGLTVKDNSGNSNPPDPNRNPKKPKKTIQPKFITYEALRAVQNDSDYSKKDAIKSYGAEYWSSGADSVARKLAQSYADDFFKDGAVIKAEIQPINPLVFDAKGFNWTQFDKIPGITELFPEVTDLMKQGVFAGDIQKYINNRAKEAGFDSVIIENVNDFFNPDVEGVDGELATTIAVLNDNIVKYIGAFEAKIVDKKMQISDTLGEIPGFYSMPKEQDANQKVLQLQQQQEAYEQWYKSTIERLGTDDANQAMVKSLQKQHDITMANFNAKIEQANISQQASNEEIVDEQIVTQEIEKQNKLLLYRRGKTSNWDKDKFRNSDMLGNSVWHGNTPVKDDNPNGALAYDFGGFGDGLYAATISGAKDIVGGLGEEDSYFEIDASKYNMYINETVEQAERMQEFLLRLQKFVLAAGDFRGFDDDIEGVTDESLFAEAGSIFDAFNMSQQEFAQWLGSMKQVVTAHGLDSKGAWTKDVDDKFLRSHNFGTRFMQSMGYDGVINHTGDAELDGNGEGSVIFDPDFDSLKNHIETTGNKWETDEEYEAFLKRVTQAVQEETNAFIEHSKAIDINTQAQKDNKTAANISSEATETITETSAIERQTTEIKENTSAKKENESVSIMDNPMFADMFGRSKGIVGPAELSGGNAELNGDNSVLLTNLNTTITNLATAINGIKDSKVDANDDNKVAIDTEGLQGVLTAITFKVQDVSEKEQVNSAIDQESINNLVGAIKTAITPQNDGDDKNSGPWAKEETLRNITGSTLGKIANSIPKVDTNNLAKNDILNRVAQATEAINGKISGKITGSIKDIAESDKVKKAQETEERNAKKAKEAADHKAAVQKLESEYKELGKLRAQRDAMPSSTERTKLQQDIKSKGDKLRRKGISLGVDAAETKKIADTAQAEEAAAIAEKKHAKEYEELIAKIKRRNELQEQSAGLDEKSRVVKDNKPLIDGLNNEIEKRQKNIELTKEEQAAIDNLNAKSEDTVRNKNNKAQDRDDAKALREEIKEARKQNNLDIADSTLNSARKTVASLWQLDPSVDSASIPQVQALQSEMKKLDATYKQVNDKVRAGQALSNEEIQALQQSSKETAYKTAQLKELIKNYTDLQNGETIGQYVGGAGSEQEQLQKAINDRFGGKAKIKEYRQNADGTISAIASVKTGTRAFTEYTVAVSQADQKIKMLTGTTKQLPGFFDNVKKKFYEITQYVSAMSLISRATQELRKGIQYVREIDLALTELKKVTDETEETYDKFLDTASKTAAKVGSTIKDVISSTADWARLGYSMEQAAKFAESTQILMNVSEFTDVSRATDTLISSVQAFGYTAETSMEVVDLLNTIGKIIAYR